MRQLLEIELKGSPYLLPNVAELYVDQQGLKATCSAFPKTKGNGARQPVNLHFDPATVLGLRRSLDIFVAQGYTQRDFAVTGELVWINNRISMINIELVKRVYVTEMEIPIFANGGSVKVKALMQMEKIQFLFYPEGVYITTSKEEILVDTVESFVKQGQDALKLEKEFRFQHEKGHSFVWARRASHDKLANEILFEISELCPAKPAGKKILL